MHLQNSAFIEAPQDVVWGVTENIERWPEWTPTMSSVERLNDGEFDVGSVALIKQPGLPRSKWVVTAMERGKRFVWECKVCGMRMKATHELSSRDLRTENTLRLEITGIAAALLWPICYFAARRALRLENIGLKKQCEQLVSTPR